jgi:hypothetical protein
VPGLMWGYFFREVGMPYRPFLLTLFRLAGWPLFAAYHQLMLSLDLFLPNTWESV